MSSPRLAVLSDVHGNHHALRAVLRQVKARGADAIVFLGDYVTDFPGGPQVLSLVRECARRLPCYLLRGNREDYMLLHRAGGTPEWREGTSSGSLLFCYNQLTDGDLDFVSDLPVCRIVAHGDCEPFTACHSSPASATEGLFFHPEQAQKYLASLSTRTMICGHSHLVRTVCRLDRRAHFIGSVGLPEGYPGCAQFAYLTHEDGFWVAENQVVPYDLPAALEEFHTTGLLEAGTFWSRAVMATARTGANHCFALISRASELARRQGVPLDQAHWEAAARDLGLI